MKSLRFAILALLLGCGQSLPNAPMVMPVANAAPLEPRRETTHINGDLEWWAHLDIETRVPQHTLFPNANGGVDAFVMTPSTSQLDALGSRASLIELDSSGAQVAMESSVDGGEISPVGIAFGERGEIVHTGNFFDEVAVEVAAIERERVSVRAGMYLVAFDAHGLVWKSTFEKAFVHSLARGPRGIIVVSGEIRSPTDFGGGPIGDNYGSVFIAAFDARGHHLFSHAFLTTDWYAEHTQVAVLADGTIDLIGRMGMNADVDFGDGPRNGGENGASYIAHFDDRGNCLKSSTIPDLRVTSVAVGPSGDVVLGGLEHGDRSGEGSRLIVRVDKDGNEMWRHSFGLEIWSRPFGTDGQFPNVVPVALDPHGNVLTAHATWRENEHWNEIIFFDKTGKLIFDRLLEGIFTISTIVFSSAGDAFLGGWNLGEPLSYGWDRLEPDPKHGIFVMKLGS